MLRSPITNRLPADARLLPERSLMRPPLLTREVGSREFIRESANFKISFFYPIPRNRRSQGFEHAFSKRSEWKTNFSNFCVIMEKLGEIRVEDDFSRRRSQILHDAHSVNDPLSGNA